MLSTLNAELFWRGMNMTGKWQHHCLFVYIGCKTVGGMVKMRDKHTLHSLVFGIARITFQTAKVLVEDTQYRGKSLSNDWTFTTNVIISRWRTYVK